VALEFLIQGTECLGFGLKGITLCRQHPHRGVIGGILIARTRLVRRREVP
jgi:hypothetical protein